MQTHTKRTYEFGHFHLDSQERLLLKAGQPVPLTPKAFDTLLLLVENGGRLVEKEELMKEVWPDSFVEENSLNRSIYLLRKALGEPSGEGKYIETVPKRGYRFVANVVELDVDEADLILEKHTSAQVITEEEEEITDSDRSELENSLGREALATSTASKINQVSGLRHLSVRISGGLAVVALAVLLYFWSTGRLGGGTTTAPVKSIAVLPFKEFNASSLDDHLGLGMADVLITRLSNLKQLNVRPTSAVMKFVEEQDLTAAARTLGVDGFLEGSIQRFGDRVRVTARLVRIADQSSIWSGQFDEKATDVFAVQDAISEQVADSLALNLNQSEKAMLRKRYSENADAYQLYVKGRYYWNKRSWPGMTQAEYFFRRAIERDPNFALAYLGLADSLFTQPTNPEAYTALSKALALDPNLGEAHATMGFAQMFHQWDWQKAEESFKRAIELKPGYGTAHQWYATLLAITGRVDEAKQEMRRALEIDPMSANFLADLGQMHYFAREYEEAEAYCRKALEVAPDFVFAHQYLVDIYLKTAREADAFEEYRKQERSEAFDVAPANTGEPDDTRLRAEYLQSGMNGFLRHRINDLGPRCTGPCYVLAKSYALLGDKEQALAGLEKSYENKDFLLPFVNADPIFDPLHNEPRFQKLLMSIGLAP